MSFVQVVAAGRVGTKGTGAGVAKGAALARTGAGVYTVTLPAPGIPAADCTVVATPEAADVALQVAHTSDTVKTISSKALAAGQAATDAEFAFVVVKHDFTP